MLLEDFLAQNNIVLMYYSFTTKVRGMCMKIDDFYLVAINPRFCSSSMKRTLTHEIIHIMENHFYRDLNESEECEKEVNSIIKDLKDKVVFDRY